MNLLFSKPLPIDDFITYINATRPRAQEIVVSE